MESLKILLFVACAVVFLTEVSSQPNRLIQGRIIGGYDVASYQLTYHVSIRHVKEKYHLCSGAILSERWVITSARCVDELSNNDIQVFYGARSLSESGKITKVAQIFKHRKFDRSSYDHDLAMLFVTSKIKFELNVVDKIRLPTHKSVENDVAMVSGWGVTTVSLSFIFRRNSLTIF